MCIASVGPSGVILYAFVLAVIGCAQSRAHGNALPLKAVSNGENLVDHDVTNSLHASRQVRQAMTGKAKPRGSCLTPECKGYCYGDCECNSTCIGSKCKNGYFGVMCTELCRCNGLPCDISTGNCSVMGHRCPPGKELVSRGEGTSECTDCSEGTYGINCAGICNPCTDIRFPNCSRSNGQCICDGGTVSLVSGIPCEDCSTPTCSDGSCSSPESQGSTPDQTITIALCVTVALLLIVVALLLVCVIRYKARSRQETTNTRYPPVVNEAQSMQNSTYGKAQPVKNSGKKGFAKNPLYEEAF